MKARYTIKAEAYFVAESSFIFLIQYTSRLNPINNIITSISFMSSPIIRNKCLK